MSCGDDLPVELLVAILYLLPAKSLCRFKCVSKAWYSLISHPEFAKRHLNQNSNNTPENLILVSDHLYSVDCTEASINDSVQATELDLGFRPIVDHYMFQILGSCNGLVLVSTEYTIKFLLNPLTREVEKIPNSPFFFDSMEIYHMYGLGYDSSANDYKVVAIDFREDIGNDDDDEDGDDDGEDDDDDEESWCNRIIFSVYSLKTDSWRRIQDVPHYHSRDAPPPTLVLVNGCLHWFSFRSSSYVIAAFDLADEKFRDVQIPSSLDNNHSNYDLMYCKLGVLRGCLCILVSHTDIWVMKEYGVTESWTKISSVCGHNTFMIEPLCLLADGEVLFEIYEEKLVAFNAKEKALRDVVVCGIPDMFKAGMTFVESLVSPYRCDGIEYLKSYQLDSDTQDGESHLGNSHFEEHYQRYEREIEQMEQMSEKMGLEMEQIREQIREQMQQIQSSWAQNANNQSCPNGSPSVPSTENFEGVNCELLYYDGTGLVVATGEVVSLDPTLLVNGAALSSECWKVLVNYIFEPEVPLYRPHPSYFLLGHANGDSIAWPSKYIKITGPSG
ncbi:F-box/kelch-repeat protein At3g06240-like isoform X2 [Cornus florida]|uniref:F-box/kelch-repeat protein At3g06240-like isoform X2 n=1 Tax=Cornus florida TaxID=4283 RepID=UPI0028A08F8E|nr:F-box/kelch-repeat protein At3g06240-like isoform X2 [Cornus florida]